MHILRRLAVFCCSCLIFTTLVVLMFKICQKNAAQKTVTPCSLTRLVLCVSVNLFQHGTKSYRTAELPMYNAQTTNFKESTSQLSQGIAQLREIFYNVFHSTASPCATVFTFLHFTSVTTGPFHSTWPIAHIITGRFKARYLNQYFCTVNIYGRDVFRWFSATNILWYFCLRYKLQPTSILTQDVTTRVSYLTRIVNWVNGQNGRYWNFYGQIQSVLTMEIYTDIDDVGEPKFVGRWDNFWLKKN